MTRYGIKWNNAKGIAAIVNDYETAKHIVRRNKNDKGKIVNLRIKKCMN